MADNYVMSGMNNPTTVMCYSPTPASCMVTSTWVVHPDWSSHPWLTAAIWRWPVPSIWISVAPQPDLLEPGRQKQSKTWQRLVRITSFAWYIFINVHPKMIYWRLTKQIFVSSVESPLLFFRLLESSVSSSTVQKVLTLRYVYRAERSITNF